MRTDQPVRLGIPGSTATVFPIHMSRLREKMWAETVNVTITFAAGTTALATMQMVQHFVQP